MAPGQSVDINDLPPEVRETKAALGDGDWRELLEREVGYQLALGKHDIIDELIRDFEKVLITRALKHTGGRRIEAATLLGWGRNTLTRKIQELKLDEDVPATAESTEV